MRIASRSSRSCLPSPRLTTRCAQLAPSPLNDLILATDQGDAGRRKIFGLAHGHDSSAIGSPFRVGQVFILPDAASPSYCSGATYLVFMKTIEALRDRGDLQLNYETLDRLMIRGQRDGAGIWGRWNANGPGHGAAFL